MFSNQQMYVGVTMIHVNLQMVKIHFTQSIPTVFLWKAVLEQTWCLITNERVRIRFENNMRGGPATVIGNRSVKQSDTKRIQKGVKKKLYGTIGAIIYL